MRLHVVAMAGRERAPTRRSSSGPRVDFVLSLQARELVMIEAAIVGLGFWGRQLVQAVQGRSETIRFAAAVEPRSNEMLPFAEQYALRLRDYAQVLADPAIDAIVIANTNSLHAEYAIRAAQAGKHVFVEKPMALTAADARATVEACRRANVALTGRLQLAFPSGPRSN
jgi:predicted dehydrogenase